MRIWIRSQDKEMLILAEAISLWCNPSSDSKNFNISAYGGIVGEYSTKEKALKVLDMIEEHLKEPKAYNYNGDTFIPVNKVLFQMPQDDEVEE